MSLPGNIEDELARVTCEEVYYEDDVLYEVLEELLEELDHPTFEMEEEAREFAGYYIDDDALCIPRGADVTDCGEDIPEWVFNC